MNSFRQTLATPLLRYLALFILFLTVMAIMPWQPQGPFDARDYQRIEGVSLSYPWWGVLLEPLFAPAQMLMNSPDMRLAIFSTLFWVIAAATGLPIWFSLRRTPHPSKLLIARRTGITLVISVILYLSYVITAAVVYFPGWKLEVDNPEWLVADLQSHTLGSHDGLVTAKKSLSWHKARGYDLFAVTEHYDTTGSFAARELADKTKDAPAVIPGVEINSESEDFILGIGLKSGDIAKYAGKTDTAYSRRFIENIHQQHDGATIALSWGLAPKRVKKLIASGIDAFEIVNTGHPDVPQKLRDELLRAEKQDGVVLVASTDWHGWGGFSRTWTLVHIPDAAQLSKTQIAERTVQLLREREQDAFVPVVAGYMGPAAWVRTLFTPLFETVRYGAELSAPRVIAWWGWFILLVGIYSRLHKRGFSALAVIAGGASLLMALTLLQRALELHGWWPGKPTTEYSLEIGSSVFWLALLSLLVASAFLLPQGWRWYRQRKVSSR